MVINSVAFKNKHNIPLSEGLSLKEISKLSKMPLKALQEVYNKGIGAYKTNPSSVRPQVKSKEMWAMARVYSFVMRRTTTFGGVDKHIAEKYNIK
tara:strand:+ start:5484 stop:5768 length:285 start_codon:yes stop_codon:yes gene_type:complete